MKIRGFRVELSEIESVLLECPGVQAAAVALREDTPGVPQLDRLSRPARRRAAGRIRHPRPALRARLPAYMMPALFETIQEIPMLSSGKVDRTQTAAAAQRAAQSRPEIVAPRTKLEQHIAAVWEKLFAPMPVSVRDNFFLDLGGHSLLAARMVSELRKETPFESLSMLDIYQHPTIERLAAQFEKNRATRSAAGGCRVQLHPLVEAFSLRLRAICCLVSHPGFLRAAMARAISDLHLDDRGRL